MSALIDHNQLDQGAVSTERLEAAVNRLASIMLGRPEIEAAKLMPFFDRLDSALNAARAETNRLTDIRQRFASERSI